jgi:hypothetical protein
VFDGSGRATHRFEFLWPLDHSVDVGDLQLDWYARDIGIGVTVGAGTTVNRTYRTLSYATDPWKGPLWSEALEIACRWARGARTLDDAAGLVTEGYYRCGRVSYDVVQGASFYTDYASRSFDIHSMIDRLNGGVGAGEFVNCTDSATTVSTFANLLGADLWQSRMESGFALNEIIAIGGTSFGFPNWGASFSYHEVAWKDGCDVNDAVFDGCLQVDADTDPTSAPRTALLPKNVRFGDCSTMDYRLRLSPPGGGGCTACQPQPTTRRRRALY